MTKNREYKLVKPESCKHPVTGRIWVCAYVIATDMIGWFPSDADNWPSGVIAVTWDSFIPMEFRSVVEVYHDGHFQTERSVIWGPASLFGHITEIQFQTFHDSRKRILGKDLGL